MAEMAILTSLTLDVMNVAIERGITWMVSWENLDCPKEWGLGQGEECDGSWS